MQYRIYYRPFIKAFVAFRFRYVYGGRGWKLLRVLDVILSCSSCDPPFLPDEEGKEFVDLLISLYQVKLRYPVRKPLSLFGLFLQLSVFPLSSTHARSKVQQPEKKCEKDSVSALDLWHETLMTVASVEHEIAHDFNSEPYLAGGSVFPRTLALWQQLSEEEAKQSRGIGFLLDTEGPTNLAVFSRPQFWCYDQASEEESRGNFA